MLNRNEFNILHLCIQQGALPIQRKIAASLSISLGTVNSAIKSLNEKGLLTEKNITEKGWEAMECYRVKRAVLFAAGFGSRLLPITLSTPKSLVRINGVRMIDTLIDAFLRAGIEDIYVVRGYLGECFDQLLIKYPNLHFIENDRFLEANSIYSAVCANNLFSNAYIADADLIIKNPDLIHKYEYDTFFYGKPVSETEDWCFLANDKHIIEGQSFGGKNCYLGVGISYWSQKDGMTLGTDVVDCYHSLGGKELYWESVPMERKKDHYKVLLRECAEDDVTEVDTFGELKAVDPAYAV